MSGHGAGESSPDVDELFDPGSPRFRQCPYDAYARVRQELPVAYHRGFDEWLVTGRHELDLILRDHVHFTSEHNLDGSYKFTAECREILDKSLFFRNALYNVHPPAARFRALMSDFFSPRSLRRLEPSIRSVARELIAELAAEGQADLLNRFAYPLPFTVFCDLIGIPRRDRARVKAWNDAWLALQVAPLDPTEQFHCAEALIEYESYLFDQLERRRTAPAEDLATVLAQATEGADPICAPEEAVVAFRFMIAAGHETTSNLISNLLHRLLVEPAHWQTVTTDPGLISIAVEECLRHDSSVQGALRVTTDDVRVGDVDLPAGSRLRLMFASVGRDPSLVDDPDTFRLDRPGPPRHLGFGAGIHYCAGAALARLETRIAIETLVEMLPGLRLADDFEPRYLPGGFIFHALESLPVRWD